MSTLIPNLGEEYKTFFVRQVLANKHLTPLDVTQSGAGMGSIKKVVQVYNSSQIGRGETKVHPVLVSPHKAGVEMAKSVIQSEGANLRTVAEGSVKKKYNTKKKASSKKGSGKKGSKGNKKKNKSTKGKKKSSKKSNSKKKDIFVS